MTELRTLAWDVESILLHERKIAPCMGDFGCWEKTPGVCILKDDALQVAKTVINCDLIMLLTPVTFGGYSSQLKKALDRLICLMSPLFMKIKGEYHHRKRYSRYPMLMGLGVLKTPDVDSERIFKTLVTRNAINLHAPQSAAIVVDRSLDEAGINRSIRDLLSFSRVRP